MFKIDKEKCIGCGLCVKDCFPKDIQIVDGKASINNVTCMKCGHCVAVCPKAAVSTDDYNMDDVKEYSKDEFSINAENLLNFIKFRRSVRQFQNKDVEKEKIDAIIEAGRFTQTATNAQDVSFIVVKDKIEDLKLLVLQALKSRGEYMLQTLPEDNVQLRRYATIWSKMYDGYLADPQNNDKLFFNAPAVIVVTANADVNGGLASSNMELMTNALGLGTFFSGFMVHCSQDNKEILEFLGVKEGKKIISCMVLGYPNVKYRRTVPRKDADISWK